MPKPKRTMFDVIGLLMSHHPTYQDLIATAIIVGEGLSSHITVADMRLFTGMVENVNTIVQTMDEPRFTLYDYLDACVNAQTDDWRDLAKEFEVAIQTNRLYPAEKRLIALAEAKRNTYENN